MRGLTAVVVMWIGWSGIVRAESAPPPNVEDRFAALAADAAAHPESPRSIATLHRMQSLLPEVVNLEAASLLIGKVADHPRAIGSVRDLARWIGAGVDVGLGRMASARARLDRLGFLQSTWVIGGFDNEGGHGHDARYAPELGPIDLSLRVRGKESTVGWRRAPALEPDGRLPLGEALRPLRMQTTYVLGQLRVSSPQRVSIGLGTSGPFKLFVDDALALEDHDEHPARVDQRLVTVALRPGSHRLLLKVSSGEAFPSAYLRVTCANGEHCWVEESPDPSRAVAGLMERERPRMAPGAGELLQSMVDRAPEDASLRSDLAVVWEATRAFDAPARRHLAELRAAIERGADDAERWRLLGAWAEDRDERREAMIHADELSRDWIEPKVDLAEADLRLGDARRAYLRLLDRVEASRSVRAWITFAEACEAVGYEGRATRIRRELATRFPESAPALMTAARAERSAGRLAEAVRLYRAALDRRHDLNGARQELAALLVDMGDVDGAAATWREAIALAPSRLSFRLRLASMLASNDRLPEARALYDEAALFAPEVDEVFEARGRMLARSGETERALADFARALELKPQNQRLRELVRTMKPEDRFAAEFLRDLRTQAKADEGRPIESGVDAVVLSAVDVVRVHENGLSSHVNQRIVRVATERGANLQRSMEIPYEPGAQEVHVEATRVLHPDGSITETRNENDRALDGPVEGMYFERRIRELQLPPLAPGDVVEWTYRIDDTSAESRFADEFGQIQFLQGAEPRREVEFVLVAPRAKAFVANQPKLKGLVHVVTDRGESRVWRWSATDVPRIEPEPRTPGLAEVAAYLHVSTFHRWPEVARFWWGLAKDQLHVTPEVARAADDAVKGIPAQDEAARVRAVYDAVVRGTRYVGLEFGIHGFKPYPVDRVLARRYGDCKDKAALMYAMLGHLGIRSQIVLLRMRHLGRLDEMPASLAAFNHAILYVPSLDLFLDGTAEFSGATELPSVDREAQALVIDETNFEASRWVETPPAQPEENATSSRSVISVERDGSARLQGATRVTGQAASMWRRHYESPSDRAERFEQAYAATYPGARVAGFDLSDPRRLEGPVEARFELQIPALLREEQGRLAISPFGTPFRYLESLAPLSSRHLALDLGAGWVNEFAYDVHLPSGLRLNGPTVVAGRDGPFGSWQLRVSPTRFGAEVSGSVRIVGGVVTPERYEELRSFLGELDRAFSAPLSLTPAPSLPAAEVSP